MEGEKYLSSEDLDAHQTAKVQTSEIRDSSRSTPPNCCATNSRLLGNFETECLLERDGCHQLFAGTYGFDLLWPTSVSYSFQLNSRPLKEEIHSSTVKSRASHLSSQCQNSTCQQSSAEVCLLACAASKGVWFNGLISAFLI